LQKKQLDVELEETFGLFLEHCISSSLKGQLIFSSISKKILGWSEFTCFLNEAMHLIVLYMINPFITCIFYLHSILDYCGKKCNT